MCATVRGLLENREFASMELRSLTSILDMGLMLDSVVANVVVGALEVVEGLKEVVVRWEC